MDSIKKNLIIEQQKMRQPIRVAIKDIIEIYKTNDDGEFYLPEEITGEIEYEFPSAVFSVELYLDQSNTIDDFKVNADYDSESDIVSVKIVYNPEVKKIITYNLIGELNELMAHELRHLGQKNQGLFKLGGKEPKEGLEYYSQPKEVDAQVFGFRRMSKITGKPFENLVKNWFETHQDIHLMNNKESEKVIDLIFDRNSKI